MAEEKNVVVSTTLNCNGCGSALHYQPGTHSLKCEHCGSVNEIPDAGEDTGLESFDYDDFVESLESAPPSPQMQSVKCKNCGSTTVLPQNVTADKCPFCSSPLVVELTEAQNYVRPHYILPFQVSLEVARQDFVMWLKTLSFAPRDLVQKASSGGAQIDGVYLPYWSFDVDASTNYDGMQGIWYYRTEYYTEEIDGEIVERSREIRETEWLPAFGTVYNSFDDLLVPASDSLTPDTRKTLGAWDFNRLVAYDERYVSGFRSETFQTAPQDALEVVKESIQPAINQSIYEDIGGDERRITGSTTQLDDIGIKYVLLPIWISSYVYKNKTYQFAVNGYTGQVSGKRPFSASKIIMIVLAILIVIAFIAFLVSKK